MLQSGSPYARSGKPLTKEQVQARRQRTAMEEVEEDLRLALQLDPKDDTDVPRDSVPDQQLDFKQLLARYRGAQAQQGGRWPSMWPTQI